MTRIRSVPVAQVRELLTTAFAACEVNTGATTPAEYAASVVDKLCPVVRPAKPPAIASVWIREHHYLHGFGFHEYHVEKQSPTKLHVAGRQYAYRGGTLYMHQEGTEWFRSLRAALQHRKEYEERDVQYHTRETEEALCEAWVLEQALAEL